MNATAPPLVTVKLGADLLDQIHAAVYWQGFQVGSLWTAVLLIIVYLLAHPHKDHP